MKVYSYISLASMFMLGTESSVVNLNDKKIHDIENNQKSLYSVDIITNDESSSNVNSKKIKYMMEYVNSKGGGVIQLPCGRIYISDTVNNHYSRILIRGCGKDHYHDGGTTSSFGTVILPTRSMDVLVHQTLPGLNHSKNSGGGFEGITVDGNSLGRNLLKVISVNSGTYDLNLMNSVGEQAAYFGALTVGSTLAEAADVQFAHVKLIIRQIDSRKSQNVDGVVFDGSSNANFSFNDDVSVQVQHVNGNAVVCRNADNNRISVGAYRPSGTGMTIYGYGSSPPSVGCYSNLFTHVSGSGDIYMRGTNDGDAAGVSNSIGWLDTANNSATPKSGTGSSWVWTESNSGAVGNARSYNAMFGSSSSDVMKGARTHDNATSIDVINDHSNAIRIRSSDNSVSWSQALHGQNIRFVQIAGSGGAVEIDNGIKLKPRKMSELPGCTGAMSGTVFAVSDARNPGYNVRITGGGSDHVIAYCDGNGWKAH